MVAKPFVVAAIRHHHGSIVEKDGEEMSPFHLSFAESDRHIGRVRVVRSQVDEQWCGMRFFSDAGAASPAKVRVKPSRKIVRVFMG